MTNRSLFLNSLSNTMLYFVVHVKHAESKLTLDGQTQAQDIRLMAGAFRFSNIQRLVLLIAIFKDLDMHLLQFAKR